MSEREPVGTLAEEAAKLLAAVHVWAGDSAGASSQAAEAGQTGQAGTSGEAGHHEDHNSAECQWCPLCRLVRMAKATSPDVRDHLSQAAVSLALAVKGLLDETRTTARRETPLEKIDLTEE
jgi:hypothetical protein